MDGIVGRMPRRDQEFRVDNPSFPTIYVLGSHRIDVVNYHFVVDFEPKHAQITPTIAGYDVNPGVLPLSRVVKCLILWASRPKRFVSNPRAEA